jgi:hypothetical protein
MDSASLFGVLHALGGRPGQLVCYKALTFRVGRRAVQGHQLTTSRAKASRDWSTKLRRCISALSKFDKGNNKGLCRMLVESVR